ncbi:MAG: zinc-ribbon domain-containing protein [Bacteroidota bacterium]
MTKHYTIEDMQKYASYHGGKCLSKEFWGISKKLKWICEKGHTWEADFQIIRQGGWCSACVKNKKNEERLEKLRTIAKEKGGECLSPEYINSKTKIQFKCNEAHVWLMRPHDILAGQWCPKCGRKRGAEKRRKPIEVFQKIAIEKGGKLLSESYKNGHTKLLWECSKGHRWLADGAMVLHAESWCPYCRGRYKDIKEMQELAARRGGKCLSGKYIDSKTKLEWQCSEGHVWKSAPYNIIDNCWCPVCGYEIQKAKQKDDIEKYRKVAIEKGGKLLSDKYVNNNTPLLWECKKGHQWKARPANIFHAGTWCPYCYGNVPKTKLYKSMPSNLGNTDTQKMIDEFFPPKEK